MTNMHPTEIITDYKLLIITSEVFHQNGLIPEKYTCEGKNINPPLDIDNIPEDAKSLVLIIEDPDAPAGTWLHWMVWNIPVTHHIHEGQIPGIQGMNDFGHFMYGGPCPPTGTHRYFFKIYALNDVLNLPEGSTRKKVETTMHEHIIAYGEQVGLYKRKRRS